MSKIPSTTQARMLANIYGNDRKEISVCTKGRDGDAPYIDATTAVLIKRGWISPYGEETHEFANGTKWRKHVLTVDGMDALEDYLREDRYKRKSQAA